MNSLHKGSTFDSFLEEEGLLDEVEAVATKRVISFLIQQLMEKKKFNKSMMAEGMHTSRTAVDRLLDPTNTAVTLNTLVKAAHVLGKKLNITLS